jgi:16S rRNA processing protein RimM
MTITVTGGDAGLWVGARHMWIERQGDDGRLFEVETCRAYRDRLVVKLRGIEEADAAARMRGRRVLVPDAEAAELPEGRYYAARLVGMEVFDEGGRRLGRVRDMLPTGGVDLLRVAPEGSESEDEEILIPLAADIVLEIDERSHRAVVRLPEGLEELNRPSGPDD